MPKDRTLDKAFWNDPDVADLTRDERLLLVAMITLLADDEGRLLGHAAYLRKEAFGYDEDMTTAVVEVMRDNITRKCRNVKLYQVNGQDYISLLNFAEYQAIRYVVASKLPEYAPDCEVKGDIPENSGKVPQNEINLLHARDRVGLGRVEKGRVGESAPQNGATPPARSRSPSSPEVPMPVDFALTPEMQKYAKDWASKYSATLDVPLMFEAFRNYFSAHQGKKHSNWEKAWQNWVVRELKEYGGHTNGKAGNVQTNGTGGNGRVPTTEDDKASEGLRRRKEAMERLHAAKGA